MGWESVNVKRKCPYCGMQIRGGAYWIHKGLCASRTPQERHEYHIAQVTRLIRALAMGQIAKRVVKIMATEQVARDYSSGLRWKYPGPRVEQQQRTDEDRYGQDMLSMSAHRKEPD